jgi:hypothetical protein
LPQPGTGAKATPLLLGPSSWHAGLALLVALEMNLVQVCSTTQLNLNLTFKLIPLAVEAKGHLAPSKQSDNPPSELDF